jgi:hypothetical protein
MSTFALPCLLSTPPKALRGAEPDLIKVSSSGNSSSLQGDARKDCRGEHGKPHRLQVRGGYVWLRSQPQATLSHCTCGSSTCVMDRQRRQPRGQAVRTHGKANTGDARKCAVMRECPVMGDPQNAVHTLGAAAASPLWTIHRLQAHAQTHCGAAPVPAKIYTATAAATAAAAAPCSCCLRRSHSPDHHVFKLA